MPPEETTEETSFHNPMCIERVEPKARTLKACEKRRAARAKVKGTAHYRIAQKAKAADDAKAKKKAEADAKAKKKAEADDAKAKKKAEADAKAKAADDAKAKKKAEADAKAKAAELATAAERPELTVECPTCKAGGGQLCITGGNPDKPRLEPYKARIDAFKASQE